MKLVRTLIDNSKDGYNMTDAIKSCLNDKRVKEVYIATGFWDLRGTTLVYDELAEFLSREGSKFRLLIGKDPYLYKSDTENYTTSKYDKQEQAWRVDLDKFAAQEQYVKVVQMLVDNLKDDDNEKFQIHVYKPEGELQDQFLHSKCYIFKGYDNEDEIPVGYGIIGSTNFTQRGMEGNSELNALETEARDVISLDPEFKKNKSHLLWFNEKWADSVSWEKEFLLQVTESKMGPNIKVPEPEPTKAPEDNTIPPFTPYEQYIKMLQIFFGDIVDKNIGEQIESYLPSNTMSLDYQIEAVKRCLSIMHTHGGFMLADVVGLGKTIVGILIAKRFLSIPDEEGREHKVLIITPPAIQRSWKNTIETFDKDADDKIMPFIDFITTGSIGGLVDAEAEDDGDDDNDSGEFESTLQDKHYGLIIIDESHKFRNSDTNMYKSLDELIQKIGTETGVFPYIGLLSATPQNNRPDELKNQIYFFERNHICSTLKKADSGNLEHFFANIRTEYAEVIGNKMDIPDSERNRRLEALSKRIRDCILSDILVRRTRTDVMKYYEEDIKNQKIIFPEICGPNSLEYQMDDELAQLFADTMMAIAPTPEEKLQGAEHIQYYRYRAIEYLINEKDRKKHTGRGNRSVENVADQLAKIMQNLLVKRLESSFAAFTKSLFNLLRYTENMQKMWENDTIFICPQIDVNSEFDIDAKTAKRGHKVTFNECVEDVRKKIKKLTAEGRNTLGQNAEYTRKSFKKDYKKLLDEDYRIIKALHDRWALNTQDPKFDRFKEALKPELFHKDVNTSGKLVIFTEAIDTANAIERVVKAKGYHPLLITAKTHESNAIIIEENFDANYEGEQKNDYDVIITTDVLAEGVNLHRANVILNYDTPWNSTKLMQRIGRVNRIGSRESRVHIFNFMPSAKGDAKIKLVRKAHTKLQSFHILFGEDSKIFSNDEKVVHYAIKRAVEGDESPMESYVFELKNYKEANPVRYQQIEECDADWNIMSKNSGNAYFLVKAPLSARLAVCIDQTNQADIISTIDLLEGARPDENATSVEHPSNWEELNKKACLTYNQYFVRLNKSRVNDKRTKAAGIIHNLLNNPLTSEESKTILGNARRLVQNGSTDIIKKIILIDEKLSEKQQLFPLTTEDIDNILNDEIAKLVSNVTRRQGEASIILGTIN